MGFRRRMKTAECDAAECRALPRLDATAPPFGGSEVKPAPLGRGPGLLSALELRELDRGIGNRHAIQRPAAILWIASRRSPSPRSKSK